LERLWSKGNNWQVKRMILVLLTLELGYGLSCTFRHWFDFGTTIQYPNMLVHPLWVNAEAVDIAFTRDLPQNSLVIIVPEKVAETFIIHLFFVLVVPPPDCNCLGLQKAKFIIPFIGGPLDQFRMCVLCIS